MTAEFCPVPQDSIQPIDVAQGLDHFLTDQPVEVILLHGPAGLIHFASHTAPTIFGQDATLSKSNLLEYVHDNDRQRVQKLFTDAALRGDRVPPVTVRIVPADQKERWVVLFTVAVKDSVGKVIELHSTLRDVTQQIMLRERIVERETLSHMTNVLAQVGGWFAEIATGRLYWSDELKHLYELDGNDEPFAFDDELVPTDDRLLEFYSKHDLERLRLAGAEVIETGVPQTLEMPMTTARGGKRHVRIFLSASYDNGVPTRIYGATQDVTEIFERERELGRLVRELTIQNDRLEEFGHLVSHQLRAPSTNIASLADVLMETEDEDELRTLHRALGDAVKLLTRTLDEVGEALRVQREIVPDAEELNLRDVILTIQGQLSHSIEDIGAGVTIDTDALPMVTYPRVYLESIIRHLLVNALRFAHTDRPLEITIRSYEQNGVPMLDISDNGSGIDLDLHGERMFRLGTTFHRHSSGRGVGLFMVRTIIESLGGEITVESELNTGTTFHLSMHRYAMEEA